MIETALAGWAWKKNIPLALIKPNFDESLPADLRPEIFKHNVLFVDDIRKEEDIAALARRKLPLHGCQIFFEMFRCDLKAMDFLAGNMAVKYDRRTTKGMGIDDALIGQIIHCGTDITDFCEVLAGFIYLERVRDAFQQKRDAKYKFSMLQRDKTGRLFWELMKDISYHSRNVDLDTIGKVQEWDDISVVSKALSVPHFAATSICYLPGIELVKLYTWMMGIKTELATRNAGIQGQIIESFRQSNKRKNKRPHRDDAGFIELSEMFRSYRFNQGLPTERPATFNEAFDEFARQKNIFTPSGYKIVFDGQQILQKSSGKKTLSYSKGSFQKKF